MVNSWLNPDGLYIKFGPDEVTSGTAYGVAGELMVEDGWHQVSVILNPLTALTTSSTIVDDNTIIPKGARIQRVTVIAETAATSAGSATLSVGLIQDDRSTVISATGVVSALALASINADGANNDLYVGTTSAGADIGVTLANAALITAKYATAAFTAGVVRLRIYYYMPGA